MNDPFDDDLDGEEAPLALPRETLREALALVSPTVPLEYAKACPLEWPFPDFREEFLRSNFLLSERVLITRWAGITSPQEIQLYFASPLRRQEREAVQFAKFQGLPPRPTDESLSWNNYKRRQTISEQIEMCEAEILSGEEVQYKGAIFDDEKGLISREVRIRLSPEQIKGKRASLAELMKMERLLNGEATEIHENRGEGDVSIEVLIVQAREKSDPEFAAALRIARQLPPDAPAPQRIGTTYEVKADVDRTSAGD